MRGRGSCIIEGGLPYQITCLHDRNALSNQRHAVSAEHNLASCTTEDRPDARKRFLIVDPREVVWPDPLAFVGARPSRRIRATAQAAWAQN